MSDEKAARAGDDQFDISTQIARPSISDFVGAARPVLDALRDYGEAVAAERAAEDARRRTKDKPDAQLVCLNGHLVTSFFHSKPAERKRNCKICGKGTIRACPSCKKPIPGSYLREYQGVRSQAAARKPEPEWEEVKVEKVEAYCPECGAAYPWTQRRQRDATLDVVSNQPNALATVERLCRRFHLVACQLQRRHANRIAHQIKDEYDVHDLLHALLRLDFDDVREEEWTPSYAGSAARMDFLLPEHGIVVEVKMTRTGLADKQVGEQLLLDIAHYQAQEKCKVLVCFVYDPVHRIRNAHGLLNDLHGQHDKLLVRVLIVPSR